MEEALDRLQDSFKEVNFNPELAASFRALWVEKKHPKGTWITEAGETERYFYYVLEGLQSIYYINQKGDRVILGFSYGGDYSGAYESFLMQEASELFIEALLPSRMLAINYKDYQSLFQLSPDFDRWSRIFLERILIGRGKREIELVTLTAQERYVKFMRRCPDILLQIPQKYLASYLNMSPETFSRFRGSVKY